MNKRYNMYLLYDMTETYTERQDYMISMLHTKEVFPLKVNESFTVIIMLPVLANSQPEQTVGSQPHIWRFHFLLTSACIICIILP